MVITQYTAYRIAATNSRLKRQPASSMKMPMTFPTMYSSAKKIKKPIINDMMPSPFLRLFCCYMLVKIIKFNTVLLVRFSTFVETKTRAICIMHCWYMYSLLVNLTFSCKKINKILPFIGIWFLCKLSFQSIKKETKNSLSFPHLFIFFSSCFDWKSSRTK